MKRITSLCIGLLLTLLGLTSKTAQAQTTYSIPNSTCSTCQSEAYGPVDICDGKYTAESDIFPSSSLTYGTVTKIAYDQLSGSASNVPIKIYMMNTSSSTQTAQSWSSELSGATLVFSGNVSFTSSGWKIITLNTSFTYSSGNLEVLVETDWAASTVCAGNPVFYYYTASSNIDEFWEGTANSSSALQSETGVIGDQPVPIQVTITPCSNPSITSQPSSSTQNICQGASATALSVTATGSSLTYQWYKNTSSSNSGGTTISGATSSNYTPPTSSTGTLYYYCLVSSLGCSTTSAVSGAININTIPTISSQSTGGQTLCQSSTATAMSVTATGTTLTYQWYSNTANSNSGGTSISGATSSSYTPSTTNTGTLYYYCTVYSNGGCPVTSAVSGAVVVSGTSAPTGTSPQVFCNSSSPTVASLTATGTSIQWYSVATGGTALNTTTALATGTYYATQTVSGCQSVTRLSVSVTVNQAPTIVSQSMGPQTICKDSFAIPMSINATGTSLTYQWYSDSVAATSGGKLIAGATSSSYTPSTLKTGTTYYYCIISGASPCGPITSSASGAFACYLCNVNGIVAGGDLSGTYPNPTVAKINGCTVPPSSTGYLYNNGAGTLSWSLGGIWNLNGTNIDYTNGNVGIGLTNPAAKLDVRGSVCIGDSTASTYSTIYTNSLIDGGGYTFTNIHPASNHPSLDLILGAGGNNIGFQTSGGNLAFLNDAEFDNNQVYFEGQFINSQSGLGLSISGARTNNQLFLAPDGNNIGIGTNNPKYPLEVYGNIASDDTIFGVDIFAQNNLSVGNFKFSSGNFVSVPDTISSKAPQLLLTAQKLSLVSDSVSMPGLADTATGLMTIDRKGNLKSASISTLVNNANLFSGTPSFNSDLACPTGIGANNVAQWWGTKSTSGAAAVYTFPCVWAGIGMNTPDAPLTIANSSSVNQFTVSQPLSGGGIGPDVFVIDNVGNTNISGTTNIANTANVGMNGPSLLGTLSINSPPPTNGNTYYSSLLIGADPSNGYGALIGLTDLNQVALGVKYTPTATDYFQLHGNGNMYTAGQVEIGNGNGHTSPDAGLTVSNPAITNQLSIYNPTSNADVFTIDNQGNTFTNGTLAINTTRVPAGYSLAVNGSIIATDVLVQLYSQWPDYVFSKGYKMMSLAELDKYISENHHLPGVPSSQDVKEKGGVDVSTMIVKQQEKLEEVSLYLIQLEKEIQELKAENEKLKAEKTK